MGYLIWGYSAKGENRGTKRMPAKVLVGVLQTILVVVFATLVLLLALMAYCLSGELIREWRERRRGRDPRRAKYWLLSRTIGPDLCLHDHDDFRRLVALLAKERPAVPFAALVCYTNGESEIWQLRLRVQGLRCNFPESSWHEFNLFLADGREVRFRAENRRDAILRLLRFVLDELDNDGLTRGPLRLEHQAA